MSQITGTRTRAITDPTLLWSTIYGEAPGLVALFAGRRTGQVARGRLTSLRTTFFRYPDDVAEAARRSLAATERGLESYFCAHLLTTCRRTKEAAAPVLALWADADGPVPADAPEPTAVVESSPGRAHLFWRLKRPLSPTAAEALNRRLAISMSADPSGWDLSQLLRPPGTRNLKYEAMPTVELVALDEGAVYHERELDLALPELPDVSGQVPAQSAADHSPSPEPALRADPYPNEFSRLSARAKNLIRAGNAGAGRPYESRSEADFAVCLAMFSAGYEEDQIRAVLMDPANGISEKYREKGRHGESYLALTLRKARLHARGTGLRHRPGKTLSRHRKQRKRL
jgi:hypothetical protein